MILGAADETVVTQLIFHLAEQYPACIHVGLGDYAAGTESAGASRAADT